LRMASLVVREVNIVWRIWSNWLGPI
jgi:hypothetical protein